MPADRAPPGLDPIDTTGAGDVFDGAFLASLLQRRTLPQGLHVANGTAMFSALTVGSVDWSSTGAPRE